MEMQSDPATLIQLVDEPEPAVVVDGYLDFRGALDLRQAAESVLERSPGLVVDLSRVSFVDSSGIRALAEVRKIAANDGKAVELRGAAVQVRRALQMSGLAGSFGMTPLRLETAEPELLSHAELRRADWQIRESVVVGRPVLVASLRETAVEAAREAGLSDTAVSDVRLAVGEALVNALKYGVHPGRDKIRLRCMSCSCAFVVEVVDQGPGFDPNSISIPDPHLLQEGGLGIHLMRSAMDDVEFVFDNQGSKVRMLKWVRRPGEE
jgi:anti-anti-sigma factor